MNVLAHQFIRIILAIVDRSVGDLRFTCSRAYIAAVGYKILLCTNVSIHFLFSFAYWWVATDLYLLKSEFFCTS